MYNFQMALCQETAIDSKSFINGPFLQSIKFSPHTSWSTTVSQASAKKNKECHLCIILSIQNWFKCFDRLDVCMSGYGSLGVRVSVCVLLQIWTFAFLFKKQDFHTHRWVQLKNTKLLAFNNIFVPSIALFAGMTEFIGFVDVPS